MRQSSDTRSDEGRILLMSQMKLYNAAAYVHMYKHVNLSQEITGIRCRSLEKEGRKRARLSADPHRGRGQGRGRLPVKVTETYKVFPMAATNSVNKQSVEQIV